MMDSIVDSFFPLLEEVEKEMANLDATMFSEAFSAATQSEEDSQRNTAQRQSGSATAISQSSSLDVEKEKDLSPALSDKIDHPSILHTQFTIPKRRIVRWGSIMDLFSNWRHFFWRNVKVKRMPRGTGTHSTVYRVARVRRLVTSLSRVLATKSEVVAQVKKRLLKTGESGLGSGTNDDHDVFVYLGDVQGA